jgi:hypothetical protein
MEAKGQPGVAPAAYPLLSSQSLDQNFVFCVSPPPRREIARGVLGIVSFRSRRVREVQYCVKRTHEGEMSPTMQSSSGPACSPYLLPRCVPR